MGRAWRWFGDLKPARQALVVIGLLVALIVVVGSIIGAATGGGKSKSSAQSQPPPPPVTRATAPPPPPSGPSAEQRATGGGGGTFPLKVSANGRYLETNGNQPFLLVGDSPQSGIGNLSPANWASFIADRSSHGFNAVWEWLPCDGYVSLCNADATTYDGIKPFTSGTSLSNYDIATPNDTYFNRAHDYASVARDSGIVMFLNPLEAGKCDPVSWITTLENNGTTKAFNFGAYLGSKFNDLDNIVWVTGNDFNCFTDSTDDNLALQVALGIESTDPGALQTLANAFAIPAYGYIGYTSLDDTTHDWTGLLDINWAYPYTPTYADVRYAYGQTPTMPTIMGEANYEAPSQPDPNVDGCQIARTCRLQYWWTMTSGATGQFYGNWNGLWLTNANYPNGIDTTAVTELGYQTALLDTISWWDLVPQANGAGQLITSGGGTFASTCPGIPCITTNTYVSAAKNPDGTLALVYAPGPSGDQTFTVDFSKMASGGTTTARWYDPTNGTYTTVTGSPFTNGGGAQSLTAGNGAANSAGDHDWVLLLQSAAGGAAGGASFSGTFDCYSSTSCPSNELPTPASCTTTIAPSSLASHMPCSHDLDASPLLIVRFGRVKHQPGLPAKATDHLGYSEAIEARHTDVQQHSVGVVPRHELHSLDAVRCLSDNRHVRKEAEEPAQQLAQDGVIVGEDDTRRRTLVLVRALCHCTPWPVATRPGRQ